MDFHIDWLFGALILDRMGSTDGELLQNPRPEGMESPGRRLIRGTQEDFDLIVAFDRRIILIEAKGVTNWEMSSSQASAAGCKSGINYRRKSSLAPMSRCLLTSSWCSRRQRDLIN